MLFTMVKIIFQNRELVAELHVSEYGGTTFGTFEKLAMFKTFMLKLFLATMNTSQFSDLTSSLFQI